MAKSEFVSGMGIGFQILKSLSEAIRNAGGGDEDVRRIETDAKLRNDIAKLIMSEGKPTGNQVIDCDADPFVPEGWSVESHKKNGKLKWDSSRIRLYLSENQKGEKYIEGNKLRKELESLPVLNVNVLDFLLKNKELIPEEWKRDEKGNNRYIYFWGTIYRGLDGRLRVRYLYWGSLDWNWHSNWLGLDWYCRSFTVLQQV